MSASSTPSTRPVRNIPAPPPHSLSTPIEPPFTLPSLPPHRTRCHAACSAGLARWVSSGPTCRGGFQVGPELTREATGLWPTDNLSLA
jgi:hypothetical protein